ncbi:MAG: HEAT repeat domain-containing protein [Anaerolineales bacterium]
MTDIDALLMKKDFKGLVTILKADSGHYPAQSFDVQRERANLKMEAAKALGKLGDKRAVEPLVEVALTGSAQNIGLRNLSIEAIKTLGGNNSAVDRLVTALADQNERVRENAAGALSLLPLSQNAVEALVAACSDQEKFVREASIWALQEAAAAGLYSDPTLFVDALKDPHFGVRGKAAHALGRRGDSSHVDLLIAALKDDESTYVRAEAAEALGKLGDRRAQTALQLAAIADDNLVVMANAQEALRQLGR